MTEALPPNNLHPTSNFPADPALLSRQQLEGHYRVMRRSHEFLVRSRAQLRRRSRESSDKRQDLMDTIHRYQDQFSAIGRERVEEFKAAQDLVRKLEAFQRSQQELEQLLSQVEDANGEGGFWGILKITQLLERIRQLLERIRQLLRGSGPSP